MFDTQFLVQAVHFGFRLGDVPVPVRYFDEASSINFRRSLKYGISTLGVVGAFWLDRLGISPVNAVWTEELTTESQRGTEKDTKKQRNKEI